MNGPFALALAAGMAATVNPCGFALLPAYLSAFVGMDDRSSRGSAVGRALAVSGVLTAGFVLVFGTFGLIVSPLALRLEEYLPWATVVIGIGLVGLGVALLMGRQLMLRIPKLQKGGSDGSLGSMFLFGVSYAVASLSCTIGPFLAVTTSTFRSENLLSGITVFVLYGLGMGIIIAILTVAVALAKSGIVNRFRNLLPVMNKIAGALLVVAGAYVAYYGWYEIRVLNGATSDPIIDRGVELQTWLQNRVVPDDPVGFAVRAAVVLAVVAVIAVVLRRRRAASAGDVPVASLATSGPTGPGSVSTGSPSDADGGDRSAPVDGGSPAPSSAGEGAAVSSIADDGQPAVEASPATP